MFNLFDILQSQSGASLQSLGQPFGLTPEQSRRAVEALLPALTIGLQRNVATDPMGLGRLFGLGGNDTRPTAPPQPDALLGQLFGSPALSQAILQQAAAASGVGTQALKQILPVMAGMIVAGIVHVMLNQPTGQSSPGREPPPLPQSDFPAMRFWNDWMTSFLATSEPKPDAKAPAPVESPKATAPALPPPAPKAATPDKDAAADMPLEMFQQMFQTGVQVQEQNAKAMQDIFDSFWSHGPNTEKAGAAPGSGALAQETTGFGAGRHAPAKPRKTKARKTTGAS